MFTYTEPRASLGCIQSPKYLANFLYKLVKHLKPTCVLDPSCGEGNLLAPWMGRTNCIGIERFPKVTISADPDSFQILEQPFENTTLDQFNWMPDLLMVNPPWNRHEEGKCYPEVFLRKIVDLFGNKIPIVFLCPMGIRLNQRVNSKRKKWLRDTLEISSIISCPLDMYPYTQFHNEILLFNVRRVKPHYWIPEPPESDRQ